MAGPNSLRRGVFSQHRIVTGAPVAVDTAADAVFPLRRGLLNCEGYDTIVATAVITAPGVATVDIEPLIYDPDVDTFTAHAATGAISNGQAVEIAALGARVFLRIDAVVGNPTEVEIRVAGGQTSK